MLREIERSIDRLNQERQAGYLALSQVSGDDNFYGFCAIERGLRFVGDVLNRALEGRSVAIVVR